MTSARTILGWVFVAILLIGGVYAAVSPILQPIRFPKISLPWIITEADSIIDHYSLVREINSSSSIKHVTLNVSVMFGALNLLFLDSPSLVCEASFRRNISMSALNTSYTETSGEHAAVRLHGKVGELNLTLGKNYQYDGVLDVRIGGMVVELGENSNISRLMLSIRYFGGLFMTVKNEASFEQIDMNLNIGGILLTVDAESLKKDGIINAGVNIGGYSMSVDVDTEKIGVRLNSTVDIGSLTIAHSSFTGSATKTQCYVETTDYTHATNHLNINAVVGLGGGTIQETQPYQFLGRNS
ncbi:MAG: hypothetical protein QHH24_01105 [Candidatus Bathyarchaeota archaeon]|nr:hypothetical protein [Candidatus Bathyarchaeota archaeon]